MHKNPRNLAILAVSAALGLAACEQEPEVINTPDPQAEALKNAPAVELPPSIRGSYAYRCRDNSLIYADFYTNDTVRVRLGSRTAEPTTLTAEGGNPPYTGEGWSVSGDGETVTINAPGKGSQSCRR